MVQSFIPAFCWLVLITFLSTRGGISMPDFNLFQMDKLGHASAYALLAWLTLWGIKQANKATGPNWRQGLGVFLFASAFGALMEFVQLNFFPNRHFEYDDMLANAIGAAAGWLIFVQYFRKTA